MKVTHLVESIRADGECFPMPLYLRAGGLGAAQEYGPFTTLPFEADALDDKGFAEQVADACNLLFRLKDGARWTAIEHAFH